MVGTSLQFLGAAHGVTGSKTLLRFNNKAILIDCGLFQGDKKLRDQNWLPLKINPKSIDAVVLTHAHLDHTGYLPRLVKSGFDGKIYCSEGTADLCEILLKDAAHLEEEQARYANESGYSNHKPALPLFTDKDVEGVLEKLVPSCRRTWINLSNGLAFDLHNAGHIIGASMVRFDLRRDQRSAQIVFSGDVGNDRLVTMRPPDDLPPCDLLILESTYGDRLHPRADIDTQLLDVLNRTLKRGGVLILPAFAVGRTQEVAYRIVNLQRQGRLAEYPVVIDSPMASRATEVFLNHKEDHGPNAIFNAKETFLPDNFELSSTPDESFMHCMREGPLVVISAAGMLSGGRVLHHLKKRLPDEKNTVVFTGYQAEGTKGRFLQENSKTAKTLRIHHEEIEIGADIVTIDSLSSHADYLDLSNWLKRAPSPPRKIITNHGNSHSQSQFATYLREECGIETITADLNETVSIKLT